MSALADVAVMKSTNASSKCSGIGMLHSSPERLARLGHRVRARQADIGEQPVIEPGSEALSGSRRRLVCSRCLAAWTYPRMVCAGCGELRSELLPIYEESDWIPHARVEGCESCGRYLISVDLRKDAAAVPPVDELAAMPLALHAESHGLSKIMPNLMGL